MTMRAGTLQSKTRANPSVAERPEIAATQTKLPSRLNTDAAAPGVSVDVCVVEGTEPDEELVATGRLTLDVREGCDEKELSDSAAVDVTATLEVGSGVSPCGIDICPVADAHGVFV
jgi:hypothetical protein